MRFTFFAGVLLFTCSSPSMGVDSGTPMTDDAGTDAGQSFDAGFDAGSFDDDVDGGCTCGDGGVCGTGALGDPVRCCNYQSDSCIASNTPCESPKRCSPRPACCRTGTCSSSVSCGGSRLCISWLASGGVAADGTACDDGRACSHATPEPTLVDCVGLDNTPGGLDCTRDYTPQLPGGAQCPVSASWCSGQSSTNGGNGGPIRLGRCCPEGTACDLRPGSPTRLKCLGNAGQGTSSNNVCAAGVCVAGDVSSCP